MKKPLRGTTSKFAHLRIAIIGVGGIGSTFAFYLASAGHDVTVVARPGSPRLRQLQRDQGIVTAEGERAAVRVADTLDDEVAYDLILVTLMAHQIDAVLPALRRSRATSVQLMFNQLDPERLRDAIGKDRCSFGMPFVQALIDDDGKLRATVGAGGQESLMSDERWVELFNRARVPAALEPNMLLWLRCHVPLCIALESVAVAGMRRGGGASFGEARVIARGAQEGLALIRGLGYPLYPRAKVVFSRVPVSAFALLLWLVSRVRSFRQLLATGIHECRALVEAMVAIAPGAEPPVDVAKIRAMAP